MDIRPEEVEEIKTIGKLYDDDIKLVKLVGGYNIAIGKKNKNSKKAEALSTGSHKALVIHQLSKEYGSDFVPAIMKSEMDQLETVIEKTEYLTKENISNGVGLFTLNKNNDVEFVLSKNGLNICHYSCKIEDKSLVLKDKFFNKSLIIDEKKTSEAIAKAMKDFVHDFQLVGIKK